MKRYAILALLLLAGCKQIDTFHEEARMESERLADDVRREARRDSLRSASRRSAAYADSVTGLTASRADKVAAVMAAEGITVGDVATFVYRYGYRVIPDSLPSAHWSPSAPGSTPVSHYLFELRGAVADTAMTFYLPQTAGAVALRVRAVAEDGRMSEWSEKGYSRGGVLPGVGE